MDYWLNSRALVPVDDLMIIYKEFMEYSLSNEGLGRALPETVAEHNLSFEKKFEIPDQVKEKYSEIGRATPLIRAKNLEKYLKTNCRIYFKREDVLPTGSFKINATIAQAYFAKENGRKTIIAETAAGQTGAAVSFAASCYGLNCKIYMVKSSYESRKDRRHQMELYGANVISSPSTQTEEGKEVLKKISDYESYPGNEAVAVSECAEDVFRTQNSATISGSFLDVVLSYQSIVGQEADIQLREQYGEKRPDIIACCVGGGSIFGGLNFPFMHLYPDDDIVYYAVESTDIPKLTKGSYTYDYPGSSTTYPKLKMYTLGHNFLPPDIHSSGLRYHGTSPIISYLLSKGRINAVALDESYALEKAEIFSRLEGIIPSPESAYGIAKIMDEAQKNENKVILGVISGNGFLDLSAYYNHKIAEKNTSTV